MTPAEDRLKALKILDATVAAGTRSREVAVQFGVGLTTLQHLFRQFAADGDSQIRCKGVHRRVAHPLSKEERKQILLTSNEPEFAALQAVQIVLIIADLSIYIGSERSFYRLLHVQGQVNRCGRDRPLQGPRLETLLQARGPNQLWSWDNTYMPKSVRGVWPYLYLVVDVWSLSTRCWLEPEVVWIYPLPPVNAITAASLMMAF